MRTLAERLAALPPDPAEDGMTDADFAAIGKQCREARGRALTHGELSLMMDELEREAER